MWGGEGLLGCGVGFGLLHRIPKPQPPESLQSEDEVYEDQFRQNFAASTSSYADGYGNGFSQHSGFEGSDDMQEQDLFVPADDIIYDDDEPEEVHLTSGRGNAAASNSTQSPPRRIISNPFLPDDDTASHTVSGQVRPPVLKVSQHDHTHEADNSTPPASSKGVEHRHAQGAPGPRSPSPSPPSTPTPSSPSRSLPPHRHDHDHDHAHDHAHDHGHDHHEHDHDHSHHHHHEHEAPHTPTAPTANRTSSFTPRTSAAQPRASITPTGGSMPRNSLSSLRGSWAGVSNRFGPVAGPGPTVSYSYSGSGNGRLSPQTPRMSAVKQSNEDVDEDDTRSSGQSWSPRSTTGSMTSIDD